MSYVQASAIRHFSLLLVLAFASSVYSEIIIDDFTDGFFSETISSEPGDGFFHRNQVGLSHVFGGQRDFVLGGVQNGPEGTATNGT